MKHSFWDTELDRFFLSFWGIFCPFTPPPPPPAPNNPENQNFEIMKKASWDVIILNLCNKNYDHMMHPYSDMECDRQFFALLPHHWPRKLKFGKNVKNTWRYYHLTKVYDKSRSYDIWFLRYQAWQTEFLAILRLFFAIYSRKTQKIKILKKWKKLLKVISF